MIEFCDVSKYYGKIPAVNGISLKVGKGEIYGFLGPNGAGKTTSIRMATGIFPPTSGTVLVNDLDIQKNPSICKAKIGYVPDRPYVYEKLTGWEFLEFIMDLYENRTDRAGELAQEYLKLFQIDHAVEMLIQDYSHGMKQKLVILSALLHEPDLIVIDEPMVGLDPRGARSLKDLFRNLARAGTSIFLSTHTMSVAEELCDRISIIHQGKILATGAMKDLRELGHHDDNLEALFLKITEEEQEAFAPSIQESGVSS